MSKFRRYRIFMQHRNSGLNGIRPSAWWGSG